MTRVSFMQTNNVVVNELEGNESKMNFMQTQLSSGKALTLPSDDPIGVVNDLGLRSNVAQRTQDSRNDDSGNTYLTVLSSTLSSYSNLYQSSREIALQGASDTLQPSDRLALNSEAKQILLQMVNVADTNYQGNYLFSGTDTKKVPYSVDTGTMNINTIANETPAGGAVGDPTDTAFALNTPIQLYDRNQTDSTNTASPYGNPQVNRVIPSTLSITGLTEGTDYSVDYINGTITFTSAAAQAQATAGTLNVNYEWVRRNELPNTNGTINCEVEPGINMNLNAKADDVFGKEGTGTDLFSSIISLMGGLQTSNQSQIESSMTPLDNSYNRLMGQETTVGASVNRLISTTNRNTQNLNTTTSLQSNVEDLDFSKAISDFTMAQTVYQASLQSAVKVLSPNLMNYM